MARELLVAQISDLHIDSRPEAIDPLKGDTRERLGRTVAYLNAMHPRPDVVLATGDLTDLGTLDEYRIARGILDRLTMPYFVIPGNHDRRDTLRAAFSGHDYLPTDGFLHYVLDGYPLRLIGLDTVIPGQEGGELCRDRLKWIEDRLSQRPEKPALIFMHHPPYRTGMPQLDDVNCRGADDFADVIRRFSGVQAVVCGHLHRATMAHVGGVRAMSIPSIAPELSLLFESSERPRYTPSRPQVGFHLWGSGMLASHIASVPD